MMRKSPFIINQNIQIFLKETERKEEKMIKK